MSKKSLFMLAVLSLAAVPAWSQSKLPEGPAREVIETNCSMCHAVDRIMTSNGFDRAGWENTLAGMLNAGSPLPASQKAMVLDYLVANFPPKALPAPALLPGNVEISIKEWAAPTPGSRPHDPLSASDGSIWYAGQFANVLGRLDPKTGQIKEYRPKTAHSGPHALMEDKSGNIWFTGNFKAYIGKLNPKTGEFTDYPMPDPKARDPHTLVFDQKGTIWFSVQGGNMVGRLVPQTGEVKLLQVPTPNARPYGMVVSSKGVPYFVEFGTNKIASIDPETLAIREYVLPNPDTRPRRIAITSDDVLWYSDYSRGYLGRFDPKTGESAEWPSPSGPKSQPYGIAATKDNVLWYSESGVQPNTVVRFDPKSEKFQTWVIPSGGGVVRNMDALNGNLALALSGVNKIAVVEIKGGVKTAQASR